MNNKLCFQPCPSNRADVYTTVNIFAWLFGSLDTELDAGDEEQQHQQLTKQQQQPTDPTEPKPVSLPGYRAIT